MSSIHCPRCGTARAPDQPECSLCGELQTSKPAPVVCSACARTSQWPDARFCPHCGEAMAELEAPEPSPARALSCPRCAKTMATWRLDANATPTLGYRGVDLHRVLGCIHCGGVWVDAATLASLIDAAVHAHARSPGSVAERRKLAVEPVVYRRCPSCAQLMHRRNFGRVSGVIVDECRSCGTWFDAGELEAVLDFVRAGGLALTERVEQEEARREAAQRERMLPPPEPPDPRMMVRYPTRGEELLLGAFVGWLARWLRRRR